MGGLGARARLVSGLLPGCGWPWWCGGVAACWLDMESCLLGLAVGLGDPWSHCRGVAACWLDAEFCRPRAYGGGLGSCGVAAGAGCDPSCA